MLRRGLLLAILFIILSSLTLISVIPEAFSQSYSTFLTLDPLPSQVSPGDIITFTGVFGTSDGYAITGATIYIKDDVDFDIDTILGTVETNDNGEFVGTWEASTRSGGGSYDFYAIYEGSSQFAKARSQIYSVFVSGSSSGYTPPPTSGSASPTYLPTAITLDRVPSSVYTDQTVTFTGKLTSSGSPVSGALVKIMEDDPLLPDQLLVRGFTDSSGRFSITWDVTGGYVETDFDVYATFDPDGTYDYARSYNQVISVLRYGGSISLDPFPSSAPIGDVVIFSGKLELNKGSTEGAIVYIKDEDPFTGDDLLATAYVGKDGRFLVNWFVNYVDADDVADIYAVFEGNDDLNRQTTCDIGGTMPIGGLCSNTIPLRISGTITPTVPTPPSDDILAGEEYIQLFYSIDFTRTPRVAIVPSPDSYNEVQRHIIPIQEGILIWKSDMERKYGGDWNVDFEIVSKDAIFFKQKPDVVVNLVTHDDEVECFMEIAGWALIREKPPETIQTYVCSTSLGIKRSNQDVEAIAAHEFIHAVGLGHTFNKKWDMMCSVEANQETCPGGTSGKSKTPSNLDLAGTAKLYGTDGFKIPNNRITFGMKFAIDDNQNGGVSIQPTPKPTPTPKKPDESEYKDLAYVSQSTYKTRIDILKSGIETAENSLTDLKYENPSSQEKLQLAWTHLYNARQHLEDAERFWSGGNFELGKKNFNRALDFYKKIDSSSVKIGRNLGSITASIGAAENWERENESPKDSAPQQEEKIKFESKPRVPDFVDPAKGAQYYIDRYNNEIEYRQWFQRNYPDYSIKDAIKISIPDAFSVKESKPRVPDFVEPSKGTQYYLDRYNNEPAYKAWFDRNYPDYTIEQAIVLAIPDALSQKEEPKEEKFCFLFWCW